MGNTSLQVTGLCFQELSCLQGHPLHYRQVCCVVLSVNIKNALYHLILAQKEAKIMSMRAVREKKSSITDAGICMEKQN